MFKELVTYLGGPMSGLPDYNYPQFARACTRLRENGFIIVSPHEIDFGETAENRGKQAYGVYVKECMKVLLECRQVAFLPGWTSSRGAMLEFNTAVLLNLPVWSYDVDLPSLFARIA